MLSAVKQLQTGWRTLQQLTQNYMARFNCKVHTLLRLFNYTEHEHVIDTHLNYQDLAAATKNMLALCHWSARHPLFEASGLVGTERKRTQFHNYIIL